MRVLKLRNDHAEHWRIKNPVLQEGEPGYERDTGLLKFGNGFDKWNDLPYYGHISDPSDLPFALQQHIESQTPHPVYDEGPSLALLYQNKKV